MLRKPTVYVIDDEPDILDIVAGLVRPIGAEVVTFGAAEDFLTGFQHDGAACLVLDVRLPGMSGLELQKKLAQANCTIPVIIVTGYADVRMALDAIRDGAVNFFEKPFRMQELFDQIQKSLREDGEWWQRHEEEQSVERRLALLKAGERAVLDRVAEGKTNEEIAKDLQLSVRGVEARRAKAMKTLRVDSKAELMRLLRISARRSAGKARCETA
jgi:two-component system, LuxR family, response regulator FixJ